MWKRRDPLHPLLTSIIILLTLSYCFVRRKMVRILACFLIRNEMNEKINFFFYLSPGQNIFWSSWTYIQYILIYHGIQSYSKPRAPPCPCFYSTFKHSFVNITCQKFRKQQSDLTSMSLDILPFETATYCKMMTSCFTANSSRTQNLCLCTVCIY